MNKSYAQGIHVPLTQTGSQTLRGKFDQFLSQRYEVSAQNARIKGYPDTRTSSEDQALAMLLCVYFSDSARSYKNEFDLLLNYYKASRNANGLMIKEVVGFTSQPPSLGGPEALIGADMDVTLALFMAAEQFPTDYQRYYDEALLISGHLSNFGITTNSGNRLLLKIFDNDYLMRMPGNISFATLKILQELNIGIFGNQNVINANYDIIDQNSWNSTVGLLSDICDMDGAPVDNSGFTGFGVIAATAPIRLAMDYYWNGEPWAKDRLDPIAVWVNGIGYNNIKAQYNLDGSSSVTWDSPLTTISLTSTMVSGSNQNFLTSGYNVYINRVGNNATPADLMAALLITGNMHNLREQ
jgi:hypothetical protein